MIRRFVSQGAIFFTDATQTWKRVDGKWQSLGKYRVLAKSTSGRLWAILDRDGKARLMHR
jgi:photosystem II stability/assembly factor-like uncharacterized protein